ncbi:hypothetical protein AB1L42_23075 [Thalassoglobus sp. JC818]|uniref:hypothetical protein n=1 Tax=Thalassoglobus sp. JC818 TaxID=3232136 RepID=UPI0034584D81
MKPLPLGFQKQLRQRSIFPPVPPSRILRDSSGKPLRDQSGQALTQSDTSDPKFIELSELYHQRVAVLAIIESLKDDPNIEFEAKLSEESPEGWAPFADAVFDEFESAGLTTGDLVAICDEVCRISNLLNQDLMREQANFSESIANGSS